jgi:hypothetical protein
MVPQANPGGTPLSPIQAAWLRALAKADRLQVRPIALGSGHYDVPSSRGGIYRVVRLNPHCTRYSCTCPAGEAGEPCYHRAAVANLPYERAGRAIYRRRAPAGRTGR